jgi:hypothetical protein
MESLVVNPPKSHWHIKGGFGSRYGLPNDRAWSNFERERPYPNVGRTEGVNIRK